jgi:hypothetical protein
MTSQLITTYYSVEVYCSNCNHDLSTIEVGLFQIPTIDVFFIISKFIVLLSSIIIDETNKYVSILIANKSRTHNQMFMLHN